MSSLLAPLLWAAPALAQTPPARATIELGAPNLLGAPVFWVFLVFALGALFGGVFTMTRRNAVTAVVGLVGTFMCLAGLYVLLQAHFLAAIQILVYAGAIMVLFIFVVMVLGREESEPWALRALLTKIIGVVALVGIAIMLMPLLVKPQVTPRAGVLPAGFGTIESFGDLLFRDYLFPFEAVSLLLLLAVIGAVVIARGRRQEAAAAAEPERSKEAS